MADTLEYCPTSSERSKNFFVARSREDYLEKIKKYLPENPVCAELGVFRGNFSEKILRIINPKTLYLIDPWAEGKDANASSAHYEVSDLGRYTIGIKGKKTVYSKKKDLTFVEERFSKEISDLTVSIKRQFSYDAKNDFEDKYFDFIYIDATHTYDSVLADLNDYFPKLKPDGVIAGHDWNKDFPGVKRAVKEFRKEKNLKFLTYGKIKLTKGQQRQHSRHKSPSDWALVRE